MFNDQMATGDSMKIITSFIVIFNTRFNIQQSLISLVIKICPRNFYGMGLLFVFCVESKPQSKSVKIDEITLDIDHITSVKSKSLFNQSNHSYTKTN